jgi:hypothetical protein
MPLERKNSKNPPTRDKLRGRAVQSFDLGMSDCASARRYAHRLLITQSGIWASCAHWPTKLILITNTFVPTEQRACASSLTWERLQNFINDKSLRRCKKGYLHVTKKYKRLFILKGKLFNASQNWKLEVRLLLLSNPVDAFVFGKILVQI